MCGIGGIYVKDRYVGDFPAEDFLDLLMMGLQSRGRDATGIVSIAADGQVGFEKKDIAANWFVLERKPQLPNTKMALVHTRWQTQGDSKNPLNNHPVVWDTCYAVHNGHISNDTSVFDDLGLTRRAEVDSEAIVACLDSAGMDSSDGIKDALEKLSGGFAIAAIDPVKAPGRLLLAKGESNPLHILNHRQVVVWSSEKDLIKQVWEILIGTPPQKNHMWSKMSAVNPDYGFYSLTQGDFWLIENDRIETDRFKPKWTYGWRGGNVDSTYGTCAHNPAYNESDWSAWEEYGVVSTLQQEANEIAEAESFDRVVPVTLYAGSAEPKHIWRKYYCTPDRENCTCACRPGCETAACTCNIEEERTITATQPPHKKLYTCTPNEYMCKHRCDSGCITNSCTCIEYVRGPESAPLVGDTRLGNGHHRCQDEGCYYGPAEHFHSYPTDAAGRVPADALADNEVITEVELDFFQARVRCESCWDWFGPMQMVDDYQTFFGALCESCADSVDENRRPEGSTKDSYQELSENIDAIHKATCKEVAQTHDVSTAYVEWLMFEASLDDLAENGGQLEAERDLFDEEYSKVYQELQEAH